MRITRRSGKRWRGRRRRITSMKKSSRRWRKRREDEDEDQKLRRNIKHVKHVYVIL